jgi:hypothetical protein
MKRSNLGDAPPAIVPKAPLDKPAVVSAMGLAAKAEPQ